jgi:DtxR family manganese transport transcriptional regulator
MQRFNRQPPAAARVPPARQAVPPAETFRRSRRDRAGETAQDYVEAIADLSATLGESRVVDLARRMGVTHVTVNRTLARLQKGGLVNTKPYRAIVLTDAGHKLAGECKQRHETVVSFLRSLGISERIAELDAEGIEHHVSPETLAVFERWLKHRNCGLLSNAPLAQAIPPRHSAPGRPRSKTPSRRAPTTSPAGRTPGNAPSTA